MRTHILVAAIVILPIAASAQKPSSATKDAVTASEAGKTPSAKSDGGGKSAIGSLASAHKFVDALRENCQLVENAGKLFAACDNTTEAARRRGSMTYLPQNATEWEALTKRLADADKLINGKGRPISVLNGGDVVAEATSGGVVTLK